MPSESHSQPDPWLDLADRLSSGEQIDFQSLEREVNDPSTQELLRAFGTLSAIAQLHRRTHLEASLDSPPLDVGSESGGDQAPPDLPAGSKTWGSLHLLESVGRGATAEVFRAHDPRLRRDVALKLLHSDRPQDEAWVERVLREGRALARVDHPNVVRVFGVEGHEGQWGMWMEWIDGRSLAQTVQSEGRLSADEAARVGERVARALSAVHAVGLVHGDVKAQNVMRAEGGRIVLMDFGSTADEREFEKLIPTPSGTPLYLGPERLGGEAPTVASDLYALGTLLFYLVTGRFPHAVGSLPELREAHRRGRGARLAELRPDLPASFVEIVEKALVPAPEGRYRTAAEMAQALAAFGRDAWILPSPDEGPSRGLSRIPARLPWALLASLALGAWLWSWWPAGGGDFEVDATLLRYGEASVEELFSGSGLDLEEDLGLRFHASADVYLYVLNQDRRGEAFVLFPLRGGQVQNPLRANQVYDLPGRVGGEEVAWTVTSEGGEEQILLVASRRPLETLEARLSAVAQAGEAGPYTALEAPLVDQLRGIGGLSPRSSSSPPASDLLQEISELARGQARSQGGVWVRRIVLHNGGS